MRFRHAVSTPLVVVIVVVVIVIGGVGYYLLRSGTNVTSTGQTSTTTTTSGTQLDPNSVKTNVLAIEAAFSARNVPKIASYYSSSSVVDWSGITQGLGGIYTGQGNIELLYASSIGHTSTITANFSNIQTATSGPGFLNVTFNVFMTGNSDVVGNLNATIKAQQEWVSNGGALSIQKENWNYLTFDVQNPSEATVFPQWGLQLTGHSPNLAQMHTIEWTYGPAIIGAVYVALLAVTATAVVLAYRSRRK